MNQDIDRDFTPSEEGSRQPLNLLVREDLYRAFQRCTWILINETGRCRTEIMDELVQDFLIKHGC